MDNEPMREVYESVSSACEKTCEICGRSIPMNYGESEESVCQACVKNRRLFSGLRDKHEEYEKFTSGVIQGCLSEYD